MDDLEWLFNYVLDADGYIYLKVDVYVVCGLEVVYSCRSMAVVYGLEVDGCCLWFGGRCLLCIFWRLMAVVYGLEVGDSLMCMVWG